jgi:DNA-binding transcriptional LysR family regulator
MLKRDHTIARRIHEACVEVGFQPHVTFSTSQLFTVERLVATGMGISLFPALAARSAPGIQFRRIEAPAPNRQLAVVRHRSFPQSKATKEFVSKLRETIHVRLKSELLRPISSGSHV